MDKMYDVPKKKSKNLDPKFGVSINKKSKPKARPTVASKIKGKPTPLKKKPTGNDAIKEFQKQISPKGMAGAEASAKKAIEKKYPGLFIPETKISPPRLKRK